jgi:hypothetical protein
VRSMKLHLHPRLLFVLRHARGFLVSSGQHILDAGPSNSYIRLWRTNMPLHPAIQSPDDPQLSRCLIPPQPFIPIQTT